MKTLTALLLLAPAALGPGLYAQFSTHDALLAAQDFLAHHETMSKYKVIIQNQEQQINVMTQQLAQLTFLAQILGNPVTNNVLAGGQDVLSCLSTTGADQSRSDLITTAQSALALASDALGLYRTAGDSFQTADGTTVERDAAAYKPLSALIRAAANHDAVVDNVKTRRERLRTAMRDTLQRLAQANTSTEVQKLQGVLSAQLSEIDTADREVTFAAQKAVVQDIENRNDREKQALARREEQAAEMNATMQHWKARLRPGTQPVVLAR